MVPHSMHPQQSILRLRHLDYVFGAENISIFTLGAKFAFLWETADSPSSTEIFACMDKSNKTNQEPEETCLCIACLLNGSQGQSFSSRNSIYGIYRDG